MLKNKLLSNKNKCYLKETIPLCKEMNDYTNETQPWKEYKEEVSKCILVCSNCHKEIHSKLGYTF